jgi:CheY-like chemotaxis protein
MQTKNKQHIVVVDDDADTREMLCAMLNRAGFKTTAAADAEEAVAHVGERVPDLLVIDYMLPEVDGMTTLQRCRSLPGAKQTPAILLTADDRLATLERAITRGFNEFVPKPILDNDAFIERLRDVLARRPA